MPDPGLPGVSPDEPALKGEIARLNKIVRSLMDRAERSTSVQGSDFSLFQTAVMLEEKVRSRTTELEAALRENEKITRALRESEVKFHGLVNQSLVGIIIMEDGKFSYANAKFNEIFGYSAEEPGGWACLISSARATGCWLRRISASDSAARRRKLITCSAACARMAP